jgi:hypothetical protein
MVLNQNDLDEILDYLDNSLAKLVQDMMSQSEFQMEQNDVNHFLSNQYDVRLENLLQRKNSNIHHLESGMKNKVIQRKQRLLEKVS